MCTFDGQQAMCVRLSRFQTCSVVITPWRSLLLLRAKTWQLDDFVIFVVGFEVAP